MPSTSAARGAAALLLALAFLLSGCETTPPPVLHLAQETISADFLLKHLVERKTAVADVKSMVRTTVASQTYKQSFNQALLVEGDASIRMDTLGPFGRSFGVFIHDAKQTVFYDLANNKIFKDGQVWAVMEEVLGTVIDFRNYISVFSGNIPFVEDLTPVDANLKEDKATYLLKATDNRGGDVEIELAADTLLPKKTARFVDGEKLYAVYWSEYSSVGNTHFPHKLLIVLPARGETMTMKFLDPTLNEGLPGDAFIFKFANLQKIKGEM